MTDKVYHVFNDLEGLRVAAEIERRGLEFYTRAMKLTADPDAKAMLRHLAEEEHEHMMAFDALYQQAAERIESSGGSADYDMESNAFLSALAADVVFPGGLTAFARGYGFDDPFALIIQAIQSEKDSILYYWECMMITKNTAARDTFHSIIAQERNHLMDLQGEMVKMLAARVQSD